MITLCRKSRHFAMPQVVGSRDKWSSERYKKTYFATNCHNLALNSRIFGTKVCTNRHKY